MDTTNDTCGDDSVVVVFIGSHMVVLRSGIMTLAQPFKAAIQSSLTRQITIVNHDPGVETPG